MVVEETFAEEEYFCPLDAGNNIEEEPTFGLHSPVGLQMRDMESPPIATTEDVDKSEYKEVCLSAMGAELNVHESLCKLSSDEIQ